MARIFIQGKQVGPQDFEAAVQDALHRQPVMSTRDLDAERLAQMRQEFEQAEGLVVCEVHPNLALVLYDVCCVLGMTDAQIETVLGAEAYAVVVGEVENQEVVTEIDD